MAAPPLGGRRLFGEKIFCGEAVFSRIPGSWQGLVIPEIAGGGSCFQHPYDLGDDPHKFFLLFHRQHAQHFFQTNGVGVRVRVVFTKKFRRRAFQNGGYLFYASESRGRVSVFYAGKSVRRHIQTGGKICLIHSQNLATSGNVCPQHGRQMGVCFSGISIPSVFC